MFANRRDAGRWLSQALAKYSTNWPVVVGLARGGVAVAAEVANRLPGELDFLVVRKIGMPGTPEVAMGATTADGQVYLNPGMSDSLKPDVVRAACRRAMEEARQRGSFLRQVRPPASLAGRTVLVVDDGLATGATMIAALRYVRARGASHVVAAAPVGSEAGCQAASRYANDLICPHQPPDFQAVSQFYRDFRQVSDEQILRRLEYATAQPQSA